MAEPKRMPWRRAMASSDSPPPRDLAAAAMAPAVGAPLAAAAAAAKVMNSRLDQVLIARPRGVR
jgi:hypothetical protein